MALRTTARLCLMLLSVAVPDVLNNLGAATAAKMPKIITTTTNSTNVKPPRFDMMLLLRVRKLDAETPNFTVFLLGAGPPRGRRPTKL